MCGIGSGERDTLLAELEAKRDAERLTVAEAAKLAEAEQLQRTDEVLSRENSQLKIDVDAGKQQLAGLRQKYVALQLELLAHKTVMQPRIGVCLNNGW